MPKLFVAALSVLLAGSLASCGPKNDDKSAPSEATKAVATTPTPTVEETPAEVAPASKLLVFVVENQSLDQMRSGMPYTYTLATKFGHATDFTAITHPSLPNYIAMASGSTQGITDDKEPAGHKLSGPSVFGQAIAAGKTAGAYADGTTTNCDTTNGGDRYVARHNPWTYFTDEREDCLKYNLPFTAFDQDVADGNLPDIAFAVPNNCHNGHDGDCSLTDADDWFKTQMDKIFAGPDWKSGKLAVVLTADEDDRESDNKVLTVVIHPSQRANVVTNPLTHYSLSRLFSEITHTTPLANAQTAPSMVEAFGLPIA